MGEESEGVKMELGSTLQEEGHCMKKSLPSDQLTNGLWWRSQSRPKIKLEEPVSVTRKSMCSE